MPKTVGEIRKVRRVYRIRGRSYRICPTKWCGMANSTLLSYSAVHRLQKSRMTFLMVVALILIIGRAREKRLGEDRAKKWCLSVLCKESENVCKSGVVNCDYSVLFFSLCSS